MPTTSSSPSINSATTTRTLVVPMSSPTIGELSLDIVIPRERDEEKRMKDEGWRMKDLTHPTVQISYSHLYTFYSLILSSFIFHHSSNPTTTRLGIVALR